MIVSQLLQKMFIRELMRTRHRDVETEYEMTNFFFFAKS